MINTVVLMGRFVADPELRQTPNGIAVTSFPLAVDTGKDKPANFFDIVAYRNTAEFACKYFKKGDMVALDGKLSSRSYEDKDGKKRKVVEVIANNLSFCGGKPVPRASANIPGDAAPAQAQSDDYQICDDNSDLPF